MTRPEKRWQLLMVADDGRIIPFRRIKGVAVTLVVLLVLAGLACAGLAWQMTAERIRHGRTRERLADARRQVERYKSENELIAAELVLAEARMEKAGMPISHRQLRIPQKPRPIETPPAVDQPIEADSTVADTLPATLPEAAPAENSVPEEQPKKPVPSAPSSEGDNTASAASGDKAKPDPGLPEKPVETATMPSEPMVGLGDLTVKLDAARQILNARFRVKNNGPRSSPVAGRCVVVFKSKRLKPTEWLALPAVVLTDGKPDGRRGQAFKISRYKDMTAKSAWQSDPSVFDTATVYVFDEKAQLLLVKDYPVDLPALPPAADTQPDAPDTSQAPQAAEPLADRGADTASTPSLTNGGAGSVPLPAANPAADDDPSLMDGGASKKRDDSRSRF